MNCSTWSGKLAGLSGVVLYFIGCSILDEAPLPFPAQIAGGGAGNQGGAGGSSNTGGSGMGGAGGMSNPCAGCIGTGGVGGASGAGGCEPFKTPCSSVKNGICDDKEQCVDHCGDIVKDGDETDIDCGGSCMNLCLGDACDPATNGSMCPDGRCVDTVCCNTDCDINCFACNLPGKVGDCTSVPDGFTDTNASITCPVGQTCHAGVCTTKKANGQMCNVNSDCASGECVGPAGMKFCKQAFGTPCADASVCASGNCTSNVCLP